MSNTDRLRSGLGLPMSDKQVVKGPVGQRASITSPQPRSTHTCQWIRSHTRGYTQQGAAFLHLNSILQKASAPPSSQAHRVLHSILRYPLVLNRLQNTTPHGYGAPPRAHPSVRTFKPDAHGKQTHVPSDLVVCRQHTPTTPTIPPPHTQNLPNPIIVYYKSTTMSLPSNLPESYKHVLLRDRPAPQLADDHLSPRSRLVGHPLAPFLIVPQLPTANHGVGTPLEPAPGVGLQTPLVFAAPQPSAHLGRAADLSARTIDSCLLTCQYSTAPPELTSFWLHGVFLPVSLHSSHMLLCASSLARRWLLEVVHGGTA
jgi:hypothetical protein